MPRQKTDYQGDTPKRLKAFFTYRGTVLSSIERKMGIANGRLGKIIDNDSAFGIDLLEKLISEYPDLNPTWLLTGQGEMLLSAGESSPALPLSAAAIPVFSSYNAIAGVLTGAEATSPIGSLMVSGVRADCAIVVSGNSMEPRYIPGDYVLLRESRPDYIEYGQPYVVELATGDVLLKVLRNSDTKYVILESENRALYSPMVVDRRDIARLYKVIGMFRKEAQ